MYFIFFNNCKNYMFVLLISGCFLSCNQPRLEYTISAKLNPHNIAPLTAELKINTNMVAQVSKVSYTVLGKSPIEQSFEMLNDSLSIPIVGLYPGTTNKVLIELYSKNGVITDTVKLKTKPLPIIFPKIEINKIDRSKMEQGLHGCDIHFANFGKFRSMPIIFDDQGIVRWFMDFSFTNEMTSPFQRLKDGNILVVTRHDIYELDMLGKIIKKTTIDDNYGMHHDAVELPNGQLLICVGKRDAFIDLGGEAIQSDSDFIILFDRVNEKIINEWDVAKHLDVTRDDVNFLRPGDWLHMNALLFDEKDQSIIISGKHQGIVKISMDNKLKWILSPKQNWGLSGRNGNGNDTNPFLLTAIDENDNPFSKRIQTGQESHPKFDFPWGQHAPKFLPNGNLIVFDNGSHRNFDDDYNYSRAVEYEINEDKKTVKQIWQYGKERGEEMFASIVSDVDYLPNSKNILVTSGHILPKSNHSGKIIEVDKETGKEIFEATLYYRSVNGQKINGWGQMDILYRSQRLNLSY